MDFRLLGEIVLGLLAGLASGLLGIGGGQILIPGMVFLLGTDQKVAQGISLAFIVPTAIAGATTHWRRGNVAPRVALVIIPGALVGGVLGASLAQVLDSATLRRLFGLFLLYMSIRMIAPTFHGRVGQAIGGLLRRGPR
ncbi:MAG: sulfite exporter TauE/SafE family protein [Chloroflexi bacterium]|nr:sulfite exporter TauE/SafE family protein [Chloroflexota bacterium]